MRAFKWTFWIVVWGLFAAFLHYTLPQWDVVRVVDTYEKRVDFGRNAIFWAGADAGAADVQSRDVFFIQTIRSDGDPMIYRNEDTGWGWPPYFKFDTSNLQAEAADLASRADAPRWAAIKHYGWRFELLSVFPNAVAIKPVAGPGERVIPWVSIAILVLIALVLWAVIARWLRFKRRRIDPVVEDVDAAWDERRMRFAEWWRNRKRPGA